jgi:hypothetical protein
LTNDHTCSGVLIDSWCCLAVQFDSFYV